MNCIVLYKVLILYLVHKKFLSLLLCITDCLFNFKIEVLSNSVSIQFINISKQNIL